MTLHVAMRILCTNKLKHLIDFAETLLKNFVETYEIIYQRHCVTFNIHGLLHLVEDVRHFGPVDSFSAFCFESHLKVLKSLIRKSDRPLEQLYNRYIERRNFCNVSVKSSKFVFQEKKEHTKSPLTHSCKSPQFQGVDFKAFFLSRKAPNNVCSLDDGSIIKICNFATSISGGINVIGKRYNKLYDLYIDPCDSSILQTYKVRNKDLRNLQNWPIESVQQKYILLPVNEKFSAVIPLLH